MWNMGFSQQLPSHKRYDYNQGFKKGSQLRFSLQHFYVVATATSRDIKNDATTD